MLCRRVGRFLSAKKAFPCGFAGLSKAQHTLPELPYNYDALEPIISANIMEIHHKKHHATYVNNLNVAEEKFAEAQAKGEMRDTRGLPTRKKKAKGQQCTEGSEIFGDQITAKSDVRRYIHCPSCGEGCYNYCYEIPVIDIDYFTGDLSGMIALQPALKFNGGGHINHSIFWTNLAPVDSVGEPTGELLEAIKRDFDSFEKFKERFSMATIAIQGSGWGWLGFNKVNKQLVIQTCANQDPLQATTGLIPLLGIDVWEHAYYLQYQNVRPDYVHAIFDVVNWDNVAQRYAEATS